MSTHAPDKMSTGHRLSTLHTQESVAASSSAECTGHERSSPLPLLLSRLSAQQAAEAPEKDTEAATAQILAIEKEIAAANLALVENSVLLARLEACQERLKTWQGLHRALWKWPSALEPTSPELQMSGLGPLLPWPAELSGAFGAQTRYMCNNMQYVHSILQHLQCDPSLRQGLAFDVQYN